MIILVWMSARFLCYWRKNDELHPRLLFSYQHRSREVWIISLRAQDCIRVALLVRTYSPFQCLQEMPPGSRVFCIGWRQAKCLESERPVWDIAWEKHFLARYLDNIDNMAVFYYWLISDWKYAFFWVQRTIEWFQQAIYHFSSFASDDEAMFR